MTESRENLHQLLKSTIARPKVSSLQFLIFIDQLISEEVLRLLELGALLSGKKGGADFSENDVDGGCESVCVGKCGLFWMNKDCHLSRLKQCIITSKRS